MEVGVATTGHVYEPVSVRLPLSESQAPIVASPRDVNHLITPECGNHRQKTSSTDVCTAVCPIRHTLEDVGAHDTEVYDKLPSEPRERTLVCPDTNLPEWQVLPVIVYKVAECILHRWHCVLNSNGGLANPQRHHGSDVSSKPP